MSIQIIHIVIFTVFGFLGGYSIARAKGSDDDLASLLKSIDNIPKNRGNL